jgi:hypothetical protein
MDTSSHLEAGYMHASLSQIALIEALANWMGPYMPPISADGSYDSLLDLPNAHFKTDTAENLRAE